MSEIIKTKWGNARVDSHGYYVISSKKEGYHNKKLHRLIYCEHNDCSLDDIDGWDVHHKDGNKLNNSPINLEIIDHPSHLKKHKTGKKLSKSHRKNISLSHIGMKHTEETKRKLSEYRKGKKISAQTKQKISKRCKGKNVGKSNGMYGKIYSIEELLQLSLSKNKTGYFRVKKCKDTSCKQGFMWAYQYRDENKKLVVISSTNIEKLEQKVKDRGLVWYKFSDEEMRTRRIKIKELE